MSDAYKCDRCSKLHGGEAPGLLTTTNTKDGVPTTVEAYPPAREWELCPNCCRSLTEWINDA